MTAIQPDHPAEATQNAGAIRAVRARLRRVRRAARALLATRVVSRLCVWGMLLIAVLVLGDLVLRFPGALRGVLLGLLLIAALWSVRRSLVPVTRFKPDLSDVALRVEQWLGRRRGGPAGPIASGIDVPIDDPDPLTRRLSRLVAAEAAGRFTSTPWGMLRFGRPAWALVAAVLVAAGLSVAFNAQPTLSVIGMSRLFMPWRDTPWPKRTQIADTTPPEAHPADTGLALRALLLKTNRAPGETTITVEYRVIDGEGHAGPAARAVLTPQPASSTPGTGELFERLIEPVVWQGATGEERQLEYSLSSGDDATPTRRIRIVDPPALVSRTTTVIPPEYARDRRGAFASGTDSAPAPPSGEMIEVGPVLPGSVVQLELAYSKPVTPRTDGGSIEAKIGAEGSTIHVEVQPSETGRIVLRAADRFDLETRDPATVQINVTPDAPPEATILTPEVDDAVLPTATVPLVGEGRDDIGLTKLELERQIARPDPSSLSGEPVPDPDAKPTIIFSRAMQAASRAEVTAPLVIADLGVEPGDEVWIRAVATDNFDLAGQTHAPVASPPRRLRVIAPARFVELLQAELEGVRRTAIRLDRQQGELIEHAKEANKAEESARADQLEQTAQQQTGVSQRLRAQTSLLDRLAQRAEQNGLDDESVRDLLDRARATTDRAAQASEKAAEKLAEEADHADSDPAQAQRAQEEVRDELARLIDQLDQGQDGWLVRRNIEQLLNEERSLADRTKEMAGKTMGRSLDELQPDERTELERIAQRQRDLAERAQDAIDQLSDRADEIREKDPTQAAAMDDAAERATREQLAQKLREAAEEIGQNQTATGGQMQEQSIEAMQDMLDQLENAQRHRDDALRRQLASVIQTIESLIRQQTAAIGPLEGDVHVREASTFAERLYTNTLAAEAETRGSFPELERVADLLKRAAGSQAEAISALRAEPADPGAAREHEGESLARLNEALEEAKRQDENAAQREQERKQRELRDAYKAALAQQMALRGESETFVGTELNRRQRADLRGLGQRQEALRTVIKAIPGEHAADDIGVLSLYHERIDGALTDAVRSLGRGTSDAAVLADQDVAIAMLKSIVETLTPKPPPQNDEFENAQGGGGGGGSGGDQPMIGNVQQLILVRNLQAIVLDQTRAGGDAAALSDLQRKLAKQTRELVEQMSRPPNPAPGGGGTGEGGAQ
ncbi:MAG: hypothetical protein H6810_09395 [Phycisphaeraceae bacterium]|nr:MAG: hypothetical protein H6810_09395 [Phycisphaeraceae bacterium]